jgi:periplasmic protein TonB
MPSRSRDDLVADCTPIGPAGRRVLAQTAKRRSRLCRSLPGSIAAHVCVAVVVVVLTAHRVPSPINPEAEPVTLVFAPAPAETLRDTSPAEDMAPEPAPPTQQPPPVPEPPPPEPLPSTEQLAIPVPEPPPPVDLMPPPAVTTPPSPPAPSKPIARPPAPKPASRPRPNNTAPVAPAPAEAQAATGGSPTAPVNPPHQAAISPGWQSALGSWLQANKTYPEDARRRGDEGRATVRFTVSREGRVTDFQLLSSTGSTVLDAAVERLLRGARLPAFPTGMDQEQVTVTLQIRYALER